MVVLDGNDCSRMCAWNVLPLHTYSIFQCMLERTDAIMSEVLEPITLVLAYPTVRVYSVTTL